MYHREKNVPRLWSLVLTSDSRSLPPRRTYLYLILSSPFSLFLSVYLSVSFMWIKLFFLKFSFFLSVSLSFSFRCLFSFILQHLSISLSFSISFQFSLSLTIFPTFLPRYVSADFSLFLYFSVFIYLLLLFFFIFSLCSLPLFFFFLYLFSSFPLNLFPSLFSFIVLFHCHKIPEENCQSLRARASTKSAIDYFCLAQFLQTLSRVSIDKRSFIYHFFFRSCNKSINKTVRNSDFSIRYSAGGIESASQHVLDSPKIFCKCESERNTLRFPPTRNRIRIRDVTSIKFRKNCRNWLHFFIHNWTSPAYELYN